MLHANLLQNGLVKSTLLYSKDSDHHRIVKEWFNSTGKLCSCFIAKRLYLACNYESGVTLFI